MTSISDKNPVHEVDELLRSTLLHDFDRAFEHIEKMIDRRQVTTSFFLTVNTAILAGAGWIVKDLQLDQTWQILAIAVLFAVGMLTCWVWRLLLMQYEIQLGWWYARLRELESQMPGSAGLITREYAELYQNSPPGLRNNRMGMTRREMVLIWIFFGLYAALILGMFGSLLR